MSKQFVAVLVAIVVGLGAVFWFTKDKSATQTSSNSSSAKLSNHVLGANKKHVNLTEYGDYQCPACGAFYPIVKQVTDKYGDDITFQFRNYPLSQLHQNARAGARAAEAAGKQNKYWEMHDLLYGGQQTWEGQSDPTATFEGYAQQLGLDLNVFKKDYQSSEINDVINADLAEGQRLGVDSTPTFFLQGKKIDKNPQDLNGFSKLIDQAIKDAKK